MTNKEIEELKDEQEMLISNFYPADQESLRRILEIERILILDEN